MADVASLAVGIAALYSACRECITIFIDWRHFEEKLTTTRRHLNIQASIFNSWGFYWELLPVDGNVEDQDSKRTFLESRSKLRTYIERSQNRYKLKGIEEALVAVAEMFCDIDKLLTKYGIQTNTCSNVKTTIGYDWDVSKLISKPIESRLRKIRESLNVYQKANWVLKDHARFKDLINNFVSFNNSLYTLCPDGAEEIMKIYLATDFLSSRHHKDFLESTADEISKMAYNKDDEPSQDGLELLADIASIKSTVMCLNGLPLTEEETKSLPIIDRKDIDWRFSEMAVWRSKKEAVYTVRRRYQDPLTLQGNKVASKNDVLRLARLICNPHLPTRLLLLNCIGIVDLSNSCEIGFLYRLPGQLGKSKSLSPYEDTNTRCPKTLSALMHYYTPSLTEKFELAKKLVYSISLMHASGWLHKNLRASSVIFFPKDEERLGSANMHVNINRPYIAGHKFSRLQVIGCKRSHGEEISTSSILIQAPPNPHIGVYAMEVDELNGRVENSPSTSQGVRKKRRCSSPKNVINERENLPLRPTSAHDIPTSTSKRFALDSKVSAEPDTHQPTLRNPTPGVGERSVHHEFKSTTKQSINTVPWKGTSGMDSKKHMVNTRPVQHSCHPHGIHDTTQESQQISLDYYQHPTKLRSPEIRYCETYDVYSLGILLLEIGLWTRLSSRELDPYSPYAFTRHLCTDKIPDLRKVCGDLYAEAVRFCLIAESPDDCNTSCNQQQLCITVATKLERCHA